MLIGYACCSRFASNPFECHKEAPAASTAAPSPPAYTWLTNLFAGEQTEGTDDASARSHKGLFQRPVSASPSSSAVERPPPPLDNSGRTTVSFFLVGITLAGVLLITAKTRRSMHRLATAKNLAHRNAQAWRRVALDLAKVNAVAANRVESLVQAVLSGEGSPPSGAAAKADVELQEARRRIREQREALQNGTAGEYRSRSESGRGLSASTSKVNEKERAGQSVRSTFLLGDLTSGLDHTFPALGSERMSLFGSWRSALDPTRLSATAINNTVWPRAGRKEGVSGADITRPTSERAARNSNGDAGAGSGHRSAEERWRRAAGLSAGTPAQSHIPQATARTSRQGQQALSAAMGKSESEGEDWVGNLDAALKQRQQQQRHDPKPQFDAEEAVTSAGEFAAQEKEGDYLLPVSELHIASRLHIAEQISNETKQPKQQTQKDAAMEDRLDRSRLDEEAESFAMFPFWHKYRDIEDILTAARDDRCRSPPAVRPEQLKKAKGDGAERKVQIEATGAATDDEIPIAWTRSGSSQNADILRSADSHRSNDDATDVSTASATTEITAAEDDHRPSWQTDFCSSARSDLPFVVCGSETEVVGNKGRPWSDVVEKEAEQRGQQEERMYDEQVIPEEPKRSVRARGPPIVQASEPARPASPPNSPPPSTATAAAYWTPSPSSSQAKVRQHDQQHQQQLQQSEHRSMSIESLKEENKHIKVKLMELETQLHHASTEMRQQREQEREGAEELPGRIRQLEDNLGSMHVWTEEIHRRLGLEGPYPFSSVKVGSDR